MTDQLRRCVRRVAGPGGSAEGDVSAAFAICTSSLQRGGYLKPRTNRPTFRGILRASVLSKQAEHASAMEEYEQMLARIRKHRAARSPRPMRGAANRTPSFSAHLQAGLAPTTVREACTRLQPLREALEDVFACDTAYGDCKPDRPSAGHCFLASMMVQDLFGGQIIAGQVNLIPHYWVRVNGIDVDITGDQFYKPRVQAKKGPLYTEGSPFIRRPQERLRQKGNARVMSLYDRLRKRLLPVLRKNGQDAIAARIGAMK